MNRKVKRKDFITATCTEDSIIEGTERKISVLFNEDIISEHEVNILIRSGLYMHDPRVVPMDTIQAELLAGRTPEGLNLENIRGFVTISKE